MLSFSSEYVHTHTSPPCVCVWDTAAGWLVNTQVNKRPFFWTVTVLHIQVAEWSPSDQITRAGDVGIITIFRDLALIQTPLKQAWGRSCSVHHQYYTLYPNMYISTCDKEPKDGFLLLKPQYRNLWGLRMKKNKETEAQFSFLIFIMLLFCQKERQVCVKN